MTKEDALVLLANAPQSDAKKSKVNPGMTQAQVVSVIREWIETLPDGSDINGRWGRDLGEKRVWQAVKNQRRPQF